MVCLMNEESYKWKIRDSEFSLCCKSFPIVLQNTFKCYLDNCVDSYQLSSKECECIEVNEIMYL